MLVTFVKDNYI